MDIDADRVYEALQAADRAGDVEAARALASQLRKWQGNLPREQRIQQIKQSNPSEYMPDSPGYQAKYGPLGGNLENFRAGAGKSFVDIGRGIGQLVGAQSREDIDAARKLDAPLMGTKAGIAGNITGSIAAATPTAFIPGVNTYTGAALVGGGLGAIQPVGTGESRALNTGIGAIGGVTGKYLGQKVSDWASRSGQNLGSAERQAAMAAAENNASVTGGGAGANAGLSGSVNVSGKGGAYTFGTVGDDASAGLTRSQKEVMRRGQAIGMKSTPGQASGSRALQQMEAKLESQPMTSGPFNAIKENNARILSREAAASIGEASDTLDSATLDNAFTRIGKVFDSAGDDVERSIDPQTFLQKFGEVQTELQGVSKGFANNDLVKMLIEHAEKGSVKGSQLQTLSSKFGKAAYREMTQPSGDRELGMGLYQMKDYVDDLLEQGMSPKRIQDFQTARKQYRNLMLLTSRVGIINPSTGNVNGVSLANLLQQKDKAGFLRGQNRTGMYDAARFAQAFKPIVGDSGTATRAPLSGAFDFLARVPYNIAARAYTSPLSVNLASRAGAVAQGAGNVSRNALGTAPYYAPFLFPGQAGLLGSELQ